MYTSLFQTIVIFHSSRLGILYKNCTWFQFIAHSVFLLRSALNSVAIFFTKENALSLSALLFGKTSNVLASFDKTKNLGLLRKMSCNLDISPQNVPMSVTGEVQSGSSSNEVN